MKSISSPSLGGMVPGIERVDGGEGVASAGKSHRVVPQGASSATFGHPAGNPTRCRTCTPPPQDTLQGDQSLHVAETQAGGEEDVDVGLVEGTTSITSSSGRHGGAGEGQGAISVVTQSEVLRREMMPRVRNRCPPSPHSLEHALQGDHAVYVQKAASGLVPV